MRASQYIYTSWKNGDSPNKGFMVYSRSPDVTEAESEEIRFAMKYVVPGDMNPAPSPEEIAENFPFAFSYFRLSSGRECVAQSTYLGRDYSGRFGNYIISALLFDPGELTVYPSELFGEDCIRTYLTEDELEAASPPPPLPRIEIDDWGNTVNDDQIIDFLSDKEDEYAYVLAAVIYAMSRGEILFFNDTRENLVMWFASIQRAFPLDLARCVTFNAYVGNFKRFDDATCRVRTVMSGVRSGEYGFNYSAGAAASGKVVLDFLGGNMTEVPVTPLEQMLAEYCTLDPAGLESWHQFLTARGVRSVGEQLYAAYDCYRLMNAEEFDLTEEKLAGIIAFCRGCGEDQFCSEIAALLADKLSDAGPLSAKTAGIVLPFLYQYAGYLQYSIHSVFERVLDRYAGPNARTAGTADMTSLNDMVEKVGREAPEGFRSFCDYLFSEDGYDGLRERVSAVRGTDSALFWFGFILGNAGIRDGIGRNERARALLNGAAGPLTGTAEGLASALGFLRDFPIGTALLSDTVILLLSRLNPDQVARNQADFGAFLNSLDPAVSQTILEAVLNTPQTSRFAVYLDAVFIRDARQPAEAFWDLYRKQFSGKPQLENVDLGPMIADCVSEQTPAEAVRILDTLPPANIRSPEAASALTAALESIPPKKLKTVPPAVLSRASGLIRQFGLSGRGAKINIMLFIAYLERNGQTVSLRDAGANAAGLFAPLPKKEYQECAELAYPLMRQCLNGWEDIRAMCRIVFHKQYFDLFTDLFTDDLKKNEKKNTPGWERMNTAVCVYLINCANREPEADALFREYGKYFRKLDDAQTGNIRQAAMSTTGNVHTDFFDRISEKENFMSRLGNILRKKS